MFRQAMRAARRRRRDRDAAARLQAAGARGRARARRRRRARQARRRGVRRLGRRRGAVRGPPHARRRRVRRRAAATPPDGATDVDVPARRRRPARALLGRLARARGGRRSCGGPATDGAMLSTSARRSTRRAARIRWSTSRSASGSCASEGARGVGCVLLDVVLGHGSHADPAGGLAPALADLAAGRPVIAHVCGTPEDPQDVAPPGGDAARRGRDRRPDERRRRAAGGAGARVRIAMLTYSVKPRGGVVHALEVSEALARRGHDVELVALARPGETLFRPTTVPMHVVRHVPADAPFDERIEAMLDGLRRGPAADPRRRRLRRRPRAGLPVGQRRARAARRRASSTTSSAPCTTSTTSPRRR